MKRSCTKTLRELHAHLIRTGFHLDPTSISPVLISYSSSSPHLADARILFDQIQPTTFNSNSMIRAYAQSEHLPKEAIPIYDQMRALDLTMNDLTFLFYLKACTRLQYILHGRKAHLHSFKLGFGSYLFISNAFIHMYGMCGDFYSARKMFDEMPDRDLVSWNSLICGYSQNSQFGEVLSVFQAMQMEGVKADAVTMVKVVLACSHLGDSEFADSVVKYIERNNVEIDVYLGNTLIDLYGRRGSVESARNIFDVMRKRNIVSWNTMIMSYAKAGKLVAARELFDKMPVKDVISWTSMITGYSHCNKFSDALKLFREMMKDRVKPDKITITTVISACAHLGTLDVGQAVHEYMYFHDIKADIHVGNSLIDMYFKCGSAEKALNVFHEMGEKDTVSWNTLITGLALNGYATEALELFADMLSKGFRPCEVTYIGVLAACTHAGLVDKGLQHFENMQKVHQIEPTTKHYGCVVDLLSRSGLLDKAYEFLKNLPIDLDAMAWRILLNACRLHRNVVLAEIVSNKLWELDPSNSGNYVLLSNTYAGLDRWADAGTMRKLMKESDVQKAPGWSSIGVNGSES
ncbi:non-specific serine/threonine protein kinase [Ranunculus cassubicifolius]